MRFELTALAVGVSLALAACGPTPSAGGCLKGSRICDGNVVLLCDPTSGQFEAERICTGETSCVTGDCVETGVGFGGDTLPPADESIADVATEDPGPVPSDPGPDPDLDLDLDPDPGPPEPDPGPPEPDPGPLEPDPGPLEPDPGPPDPDPGPPEPDPGPPEPDPGPPEPDPGPEPPCGNGKLDVGETCDPSAGAPCLESCPSQNACNAYESVGDAAACTADCVGFVVSDPVDGDECCPPGLTSTADTDCPPPDCGSPFACQLAYEPLPNFLAVDDLRRVRWHPEGGFALLLGTGGKVFRWQAEGSAEISAVATLGSQVVDLDVDPAGGFFIVVGQAGAAGRLWRLPVAEDGTVGEAVMTPVPQGTPSAVVVRPGANDFVIAAAGGSLINYLHRWSAEEGLFDLMGYNNPGVRDLMWAAPELYGGSDAVITADGQSGAGSKSWLLASDLVVANGWKGSFGNPGGAAWRPGGGYGLVTGWTSNKVYAFDGAWQAITLPGVGTAASPNAVAWKPDGTRAVVVGRAIGPGLSATVIDHRPTSAALDPGAFYNASIPNFGASPFNGTTSTHLLDADWRPGSCGEGLIVGSDNGSAFSPTFGLLIRFYDQDACAP